MKLLRHNVKGKESPARMPRKGANALLARAYAPGRKSGRVARKIASRLCTPRRAFAIARPLLPLSRGYHMGLRALRRTM